MSPWRMGGRSLMHLLIPPLHAEPFGCGRPAHPEITQAAVREHDAFIGPDPIHHPADLAASLEAVRCRKRCGRTLREPVQVTAQLGGGIEPTTGDAVRSGEA